MAEYYVYPLYGVGCLSNFMGCRYILGVSKIINNIRLFRDDIWRTDYSLAIIDWKSRRYKLYINGLQYPWVRFRMNDFYDRFRFCYPCDDWEIAYKGGISDAHNYQNVINFNTFNVKKYCKGE